LTILTIQFQVPSAYFLESSFNNQARLKLSASS